MAVSCNLVAMSSVAYTCIVDVQGVLPEHVHEYVCRNAEILDYLNPRTVCWQLVIYISVQLVGCVVWYDVSSPPALLTLVTKSHLLSHYQNVLSTFECSLCCPHGWRRQWPPPWLAPYCWQRHCWQLL